MRIGSDPHGFDPADGFDAQGRARESLDLGAVQHDDALLDALAAGSPVVTNDDTEYELAGLMAALRGEVLAAPVPEQPTVEDVEAATAARSRRERTRATVRHLRLASGAAAVVVVAAAGLVVLAEGSEPGDPLWGVKTVVFAEQATETQASVNAQADLEQAEAALASGDTEQARSLVAKAEQEITPIRDEDTVARMRDWITRLKVDTSPTPVPTERDSTTVVPPTTDPAQVPDLTLRTAPDEPVPTEPPVDPGEPPVNDSSETPPPATTTPKPSSPPSSSPPPVSTTISGLPTIMERPSATA